MHIYIDKSSMLHTEHRLFQSCNNLLVKDRTVAQREGRKGLPEGSQASVTFQESFMLLQSVTAQKTKQVCPISKNALKVAHQGRCYLLKCCGASFAAYFFKTLVHL